MQKIYKKIIIISSKTKSQVSFFGVTTLAFIYITASLYFISECQIICFNPILSVSSLTHVLHCHCPLYTIPFSVLVCYHLFVILSVHTLQSAFAIHHIQPCSQFTIHPLFQLWMCCYCFAPHILHPLYCELLCTVQVSSFNLRLP